MVYQTLPLIKLISEITLPMSSQKHIKYLLLIERKEAMTEKAEI